MGMLHNKKILLAVTGSIAAYKAASLVRLLVKQGAQVRVISTEAANSFITPLTLATLSKNEVLTAYTRENGTWNNHVELGLWADVMLVAPASANTLAKMAHGICDNLLLATFLSARCSVVVAPAMDLDMYAHAATQDNLNLLKKRGVLLIEPSEGELASGLIGQGRMTEPEEITQWLLQHFSDTLALRGKRVLVTAGPTYEAIDPVRFIGNHSSGKMGYALAEKLAEAGAQVCLVSGPSQLQVMHPNIELLKVVSAQEMYEACVSRYAQQDVAILSAAVADYRPATVASQKIKKQGNDAPVIELVKTPDILAELGKLKQHQLLVGFALETNNELENAKIKLQTKNLDFIVLNSLQDSGAGFQGDQNKITILDKRGNVVAFELKPKPLVAQDIVDKVIAELSSNL